MASETLSLFPSPVSSIPPKSCLRQTEEIHARRNTPSPTLSSKPYPSGLRGLALQLTPQSGKHATNESPNVTTRPSPFTSPVSTRSPDGSVLSNSLPSGIASMHKKRPAVAVRKISLETTTSATRSDFSGPTLVRSNSGSSVQPKMVSPPMKSIFPEYDPTLPLSQQRYYPTDDVPRPSLQRRTGYHQPLASEPSPISPTSPVPAAGLSQLQALWNAASGQNAIFHSEKIKLTMHRDEIGSGSMATELRFGSREGRTLYSVSAVDSSSELTIRRHHPARTGIVPVAQVDVATAHKDQKSETTIFPQQAALAALEAAATTHRANAIAQYDPRASSPQAAQLAFDAVAEAKAQESCQLVRLLQESNGFGIEEHKYELRHPRTGNFEIRVEGAFDIINKESLGSCGGRVTLYQPHDASTTSSTKPHKLITFDMATETLDIDVASFRKLDSRFMIDSAICGVLAVAFAQSNVTQTKVKEETFAGPPLTEIKVEDLKKKARDSRWRRSLGRKKDKKENASKEERLPGLTRGLLYVLGFSFEAVVWLLGLGVRVLSKVIVCASGVVSRK